MSIQLCQCIPCFAKRDFPVTDAEEASLVSFLSLDTLENVFEYLDTNALLAASSICKRWRFVAATIYSKFPDHLYSTPCFQPFYDDFYASRHLFLFDVSSSMNKERRDNAKIIYDKITRFIAPIIENRGVYICKFAGAHDLKYFNSSECARAFIDEASKVPDGSNLSSAVVEVVKKIVQRNEKDPKNNHVHIISDMEVVFDQSILLGQDLLATKSKITFHYYDAAKQGENDFLKDTKATFHALKDNNFPGTDPRVKKRYSDSVELKFYPSKKAKVETKV